MSEAVVDASVVLKWVLPEPDSALALRLRTWRLVAPEFLLLECGNALWVRARRRLMPAEEVPVAMAELAAGPVKLESIRDVVCDALDLASRLDHPIYDCCYLALAHALGLPVVSADRRLRDVVGRSPGAGLPTVLMLVDLDGVA